VNRQNIVIAATAVRPEDGCMDPARPSEPARPIEPARIALVAFDGFQLLDLAGPADVFSTASLLGADPPYETVVATPRGRAATAVSGVRVAADLAVSDLAQGGAPLDSVMVVGGLGVRDAAGDGELCDELRRVAAHSRRITSVCSGALLLAAAGLLDGHEATTHWSAVGELEEHPEVTVLGDRIYVHDRDRWTSAGVTAGIDLALALVEHDHGPDLAHTTAAWLVVFARRPGGQSQFSTQLRVRPARREELRELQRWIPDNLGADLTVAALAARVDMSERTLVRAWREETGTTLGAYVEETRVEAARRLLETTDLTVAAVSVAVGLQRPDRLHRAVRRRLGTTPDQYRRHFARN
jgi:transcriptional regulator GlxA family with amidase domain